MNGLFNSLKRLKVFLMAGVFLAGAMVAFGGVDGTAKSANVPKGARVGEAADRIIVKFRDKVGPTAKDKILFKHRLKEKREIPKLGLRIMGISAEDTPQEVVDRLKAQEADSIEFAEVDALIEPSATVNDPNFSSQWHVTKIQGSTAWDTTKGSSILVAVLDTGTDCTHPDLVANCVPGWNVVSNNSDSSDIHGHGTKTAGTVAEVGNNAVGSAGVAIDAKIIPIRITNDTAGYAYWSDITNGIMYAADHGAKVVTNSYHSSVSSSVQSAASYLRSKGGIFLCGSGNEGALQTIANPFSVITLAATDSNDNRASWSNYGDEIDVSAPGVGIYTTTRGGGYASVSGTSFATPAAAGVVALIFAANPTLTPDQAESILKSTAVDLGTVGWDQYYGWGRVNAAAAVVLAKNSTGNLDTIPPTAPANLVVSSIDSASVKLSWSPSVDLVGVAGYKVYRDGIETGSSAMTSFSDGKVVSGSTYNYSVKAFDAASNMSASSNVVTAVVPQAPVVVAILSYSVSQKTATAATINWTTSLPSTGIVSYGASKTGLNLSATDNTLGTIHNVTLSGLKGFTQYSYKITAVSGDGTSNATTVVSNFKTLRR